MNSHPWSKGIGRFLGWRLNACALVVMMALLPSLWLGFSTLHGSGLKDAWSGPFLGALWRSLALSSAVLVIALALGWPLGTLMGLARFPGRRLFLAALVVPLFTPATLWAIGLSSARSLLPYRHRWWFDGFSGALLTGIVQALPLVIVATLLAVRTLPAAPIEAARLAGGLRSLALASVRFSLAAGLAAAGLGALMAIADPGPAQIMGYHGVASEVLIAFSANYDSAQAAGKAIVMTLLLLPMLMPLA